MRVGLTLAEAADYVRSKRTDLKAYAAQLVVLELIRTGQLRTLTVYDGATARQIVPRTWVDRWLERKEIEHGKKSSTGRYRGIRGVTS